MYKRQICDFVADVRAATPTAAAELACTDVQTLINQLSHIWRRLERCMDTGLKTRAQKLDYLARRLISPMQQIENKFIQTNQIKHRMDIAFQGMLKTKQQHMLQLQNSLAQLNPKNVLARGYAMVQDDNGNMIKSSLETKAGQPISVIFHDGSADATVNHVKSS